MAEKQFKLKFDGANAKAVDEYLEYSRYLFSFFFSLSDPNLIGRIASEIVDLLALSLLIFIDLKGGSKYSIMVTFK